MVENLNIIKIEAVPSALHMFVDFGNLLSISDISSVLYHPVLHLPSGFAYISCVAVSTIQFVYDSGSLMNRSSIF